MWERRERHAHEVRRDRGGPALASMRRDPGQVEQRNALLLTRFLQRARREQRPELVEPGVDVDLIGPCWILLRHAMRQIGDDRAEPADRTAVSLARFARGLVSQP